MQPIDEEILSLLVNKGRSLSITDISTVLHHGRHTIARYLDNLLHTGKVSMCQHGQKKKYYIPSFVPHNSIETFSPHIQIIFKNDFTILQVNDQFLHLTGLTQDSFIGLRPFPLPNETLDVNKLLAKLTTLKEGQPIIFEDTLHIPGNDLIFQFTLSFYSYRKQESLIFLSGEDISAKKQLEQVIRDREEQFRTLVTNIPGIVFRLNISTKQFEYCSGLFEITGYTPDLLFPYYIHPFESLILRSDLQSICAVLERSLVTRNMYEITYRIRHHNGQVIHLIERGKPVPDHGGLFTYIDGIIFDVSNHKRIEEKLIESENRLRYALEGSQEGLWEWNLSTHTGYFSPQFYCLLGYKPDEFPATLEALSRLLPPEETESYISNFFSQVYSNRKRIEFECRIRKKDGGWCWILARGKPFEWDDQGNAIRVIGTNEDITRQINAEFDFKESKERFSKLIYIRNAAIAHHEIICNEKGDLIDWRYLFVNSAFERISGYKAVEIIGKTLLEVFGGIKEKLLKYIREVMHTGKTLQFSEYFYIFGMFFEVIVFNPCTGQFTVLLSDISERLKVFEEFTESKTLLESSQSLAKIGGWEFDVERQIIKMTKEAYLIYGFEPAGLVPDSPEYYLRSTACYHPDDLLIIYDLFSRCIHEGESFIREFPITTVDGRQIWIRLVAEGVIEGDRVTKIIGNIIDLSDHSDDFQRHLRGQ